MRLPEKKKAELDIGYNSFIFRGVSINVPAQVFYSLY